MGIKVNAQSPNSNSSLRIFVIIYPSFFQPATAHHFILRFLTSNERQRKSVELFSVYMSEATK